MQQFIIRRVGRFVRRRLDERSTWRAIVAFLTLLGIGLNTEQTEAVIMAGVAVGAALEALLPDPGGNIVEPDPGRPANRVRDVSARASDQEPDAGRRSGADESRNTWLGND
jgi:hypothetical protein